MIKPKEIRDLNSFLAKSGNLPCTVSPKLDGIRCLIVDGVAMSRTMKPIPNRHIQSIIGRPELNGIDGELIVGGRFGPDTFNRTTRGVMSVDGAPGFSYNIFDYDEAVPLPIVPVQLLYGFPERVIHCVSRISVLDASEVLMHEELFVKRGYEGIIIRNTNGVFKYKRFADAEAVVVGFEPLVSNTKGDMIGALRVRDLNTGVKFKIGTGFTDDTRRVLFKNRWHLDGLYVKYRYQPAGEQTKPRFPSFIGFRDEIDL